MRNLNLLIMGLSFFLFVGCLGGGEKAATQPSVSDNSSSGTGEPSEPVVDPNPPVVVEPPGATPGDKVEVSEGTQGASYPAVGSTVSYEINPYVEPNTDTNAPIIAIVAHPSPYIPQATGTISLWAADDINGIGLKEIQCRVDDGQYTACNSQVQMENLTEGLHTLEARAVDHDGNQSGEVSYAFFVDTIPPTVTLANAPAPTTNQPTSQFQFQAVDSGSGVASYQCRLDNGAFETCDTNKTYANVPQGNHTVTIRALDQVGNISSTVSHQWVVDTQGPVIRFVTQPSSISYIETDKPVVNFVATDALSPVGIQTSCTLNNKPISCSSGVNLNIPLSATPSIYVFAVIARDAAGNTSNSSIQWQGVFRAQNKSTLVMVGEDRPVDILFVVDNSGSMNFERSNLAERIDGLISKIAGLDWQIAVTSTDATTNDAKSNGQLIELIGLPGEYILDSKMNVNFAQNIFGNTVQNFAGGSGNEEGIYSSKRVIDRYIAGQAIHREFIRPGADLSIVLLSDEDEASTGDNIRITPQNFVNFVDATFAGTKNMVFHSIIARPGDAACLQGEGAAAGDVYDELSRLTGFGEVGGAIIGSVCNADYTSQLADIGQSVKDLRNSIRLECPPYDANKDGQPDLVISYRANSTSAFAVYSATRQIQGDLVSFPNLLPPGEYKADYQCQIN